MTDRLAAALAELVEALAEVVRVEAGTGSAASDPPRAWSVEEAAEFAGIGRTFAYREIKAGRLRVIRRGRRVIVPDSSLRAYIEGNASQ